MKASIILFSFGALALLTPGGLGAQEARTADPISADPLGIPGRVPLDSIHITLVRSDDLERTPTYEVTLRGTGEVEFRGDRYFDTPGPRFASFDPSALVGR